MAWATPRWRGLLGGIAPELRDQRRGLGVGVDIEVDLYKRVRLEIAVNDDFVDPTIEAIVEGAKTGENGDGKIFVTPLERVIRIRSGESDSAAIG